MLAGSAVLAALLGVAAAQLSSLPNYTVVRVGLVVEPAWAGQQQLATLVTQSAGPDWD